MSRLNSAILASLYLAMITMPNTDMLKDSEPGLSKKWDGARNSKDYVSTKKGMIRKTPKVKRNSLCSCGSNKKHKNCCGRKNQE